MADFTNLKDNIKSKIKSNGKQEVTGAILQEQMIDIVDQMNETFTGELTELESESYVKFAFGGVDYVNGEVVINDIRCVSGFIRANRSNKFTYIRLAKPDNMEIAYSQKFGKYSVFLYDADFGFIGAIVAGYIQIYDTLVRLEITDFSNVGYVRIVLSDINAGTISESDVSRCYAYRTSADDNATYPFEFGAIDPETGEMYNNNIRIRARIYYKPFAQDSGRAYGKVSVPSSLIPAQLSNGKILAYAYKGQTPIKEVPSLEIEGNVVKFLPDNSYDNIVICYKKSDGTVITDDELYQCFVSIENAMPIQVFHNSIDSLHCIRKINNLSSTLIKAGFDYGSVDLDNGEYINYYPKGSYTANKIRIRSYPIFISNGNIRIELANRSDLMVSAILAYKGINYVGTVAFVNYEDFVTFDKFNDDYDNVVIVAKKTDGTEITATEKEAIYAHGLIGQILYVGKTLKYCAIGDSITYGFIPRNAEGYPGQLKSYARLVAERLGLNFLNYGISGSTIANIENPMSVRFADMPNDADIVTVMGGTNDQWRGVPLGTMSDRTNDTFYGALHVLYQGLYTKYIANAEPDEGAKRKIVVLTPIKKLNPDKATLSNTVDNNANALQPLGDFVKAVKEVADFYSFHVLDMYNESGLNPHLDRTVVGFETGYTGNYNPYVVDGTHPTEAGHEIMAKVLSGYLKTIL